MLVQQTHQLTYFKETFIERVIWCTVQGIPVTNSASLAEQLLWFLSLVAPGWLEVFSGFQQNW